MIITLLNRVKISLTLNGKTTQKHFSTVITAVIQHKVMCMEFMGNLNKK